MNKTRAERRIEAIMSFLSRPICAGAAAVLLILPAAAQEQIVPKPVEIAVEADGGPIVIDKSTRLFFDAATLSSRKPADQAAARYVARYLREGTGLPLKVAEPSSGAKGAAIVFTPDPTLAKNGPEAYAMKATAGHSGKPSLIEVRTASPKALYPAVHTLAQMMPPAFFDSGADKSAVTWKLADKPFSIVDYPRFAWRSFMLDEARYFFGVETVKAILDQMALLKMNVLHWHLTDDVGWRIEIKKYPKLTKIGAKRRDTELVTWGSGKMAGKPHEGFYTQNQLREIVAYAAERGIMIIPEIDVPGHSGAFCASYPELRLTLKQPKEVPATFGQNTALDPTNEKVYTVLSDILDEVIAIFPSPYIHMGGDEVRHKECWQGEPAIDAFMKKNGYKNLNEVQIHFTNRLSRILASKGRRMMGWNEILGHDVHGDGGGKASKNNLAPNTVVNYWYGQPGPVIQAIKRGHEVINSTSAFTYMTNYKKVDLKKAYSFNPDFPNLSEQEQKRVLGMGCHAWTEWVPTSKELYYQIYPRLIAHAETAWSPKKAKNYDDFLRRVEAFRKILDIWKIPYAAEEIK